MLHQFENVFKNFCLDKLAHFTCRRMPLKVGNILENEFHFLYESDIFKNLRKPKNIPTGCINCDYSNYCSGGLRCLSYAIHQTPFNKDPGCWLNEKKI